MRDEPNLQRVRCDDLADHGSQHANHSERVCRRFENDFVTGQKAATECDEALAVELNAAQLHEPVSLERYGLRKVAVDIESKGTRGITSLPLTRARRWATRQPDRQTALGDRDHALLLFLYNSGARADEAATVTIDRLQLGARSSVRLHGKGNKFRTCPLWPVTATSLSRLIANRGKNEPVFLNRSNQPLTRFGIHRLVGQYAEQASRTVPSMATKQVSPHTIRHTTAVHLLRAGVDINTIRAWLGHVSLDTTHVYAEVDMEMKAKALASVDISSLQTRPWQRPLPSLMTFLKAL